MGREDVLQMLKEKRAAKERAGKERAVAQPGHVPAFELPSLDPVIVSGGSSPKVSGAEETVQHIPVPEVVGQPDLSTFDDLVNVPQPIPGKGTGPMMKKRLGIEPRKRNEPV